VSARTLARGCSRLAAFSLAALTLISPLSAQKSTPVPSRPVLEAGADTNDARSYFGYGMKTVYDKPSEAVRGFYWASRINPTSAEALYSLQCASLLAMSNDDMASEYRQYVAVAPRSDPNLPFVNGRLSALAGAASSTAATP
jgi:hypothetical protein